MDNIQQKKRTELLQFRSEQQPFVDMLVDS